jgi:TRAP transporter TAXI family solute receptor
MFGVQLSARGVSLRASIALLLCMIADVAVAEPAKARKVSRSETSAAVVTASRLGEASNKNTVGVVSGNINGTYLSIAYDLSAVLDDGDNLRILPIIGKGGGQNIRDVRFLRGVDLGITQANLLNVYRRSNEIGPVDDRFVYIAKLFNEEMHVVVRADSGVATIEELAGKRVNFSNVGSGTQLTTRDVFQRLGIKAEEVNLGQADALEKLRGGEIAATVLIAGKPAGAMAKLKADGFRLLPVPYARVLHNDYLPTRLASEDYPGLIEPGRTVDTIAVGAVLIAYNWPKDSERYRRLARFVEAFFPRLAEFQRPPRHAKWRETNLAAVLPGWTRFEPAERWLETNRARLNAAARGQFDQFLVEHSSPERGPTTEEREQLFREFLQWNGARERR